jgi:hypothetical protein
MRASLSWLLVWALPVLACAPPARVQYEERVESAPPASAHAVHAERLSEVMRALNRLVDERLPRAMDTRAVREGRREELAAVAGAIAVSAGQIPARVDERGLSHAERRLFDGRARVLEQRARSLAEDAPSLTTEQIGARVDAIREACAACHGRFRDGLPGDRP